MIKKFTSLAILLFIIYSCATVQSPTGGEKDEKAPILYESNPEDQSINFKGKEIKLYFNEWMKLEQLQSELIITPREEIEFESVLKKQELIITLEEPLKDSTTYTFNFRKALKDITEGNLWEKPVIAFSTGPFLDSLEISGNVINIKNNTLQEGFLVGLYSNDYDTANLRQGKPVYFTITDENGYYRMNNLKAGKYKLYAFKDSNDDLLNNSQSESFGFHSEVIELYDSIGKININSYTRNEDTLKLNKFSPTGKDFTIQYNKGLKHYLVTNPKDSNQYIYTNDVENSKNLKIFKENFPDLAYETDSTLLIVNSTDSIGSVRTDSVYSKFRESRVTNDSIKVIGQPESKIISGRQNFEIRLSKPIQSITYDSIQLRIDTIPIHTFEEKDITFNFNKKKVTVNTLIEYNKVENMIDSLIQLRQQLTTDSNNNVNDSTIASDSTQKTQELTDQITPAIGKDVGKNKSSQGAKPKLELYIGRAAFIGIENDSSKKVNIPLTFKKAEDYGIIKGAVIDADFPFIIELMNEKYEVKDTLINKNKFQFNYVDPGKYRLRLIKDKNNNQQWDAGDPLLLKKEEELIYFNQVITVKANWEVIDQNFDFSVDNEVDNSEEEDDL